MPRKKSLSPLSLAQVMALIGFILAGYFLIGFGKVAIRGHQLRITKAELERDVADLRAGLDRLEARKAYVQSDAYVERSAREEFKMSRPGDQVVAPIIEDEAETDPESVPTLQPSASPEPTEPWQAWWDLFFDR